MKRLFIGIGLGALLGVFCIIGALTRTEESLETVYLAAFWYNRVILGLALGIAMPTKTMKNALIRGGIVGVVISFAFYISTGFNDVVGFIAGIVYGFIIAYVLYVYDKKSA